MRVPSSGIDQELIIKSYFSGILNRGSDYEKTDWLKFDARIKAYKNGYVNFKKDKGMRYRDYTLSYPTKIEKV